MSRIITVVLLLFFGLIFMPTAQAQTIWYVNDDASGSNDGTSWENAFNELQAALAVAQVGEQIWVAQGVYKPDYNAATGQHTGDRTASFQLMNGVAIYGGFTGGELAFEDRAGSSDATILSGDLNGDDGPEFGNNDENSYHILTGSSTDRSALLDSFLIRGGNADGSFPHNLGAGMLNVIGSPAVNKCTFYGNWAHFGAGMMNNSLSSPLVTQSQFLFNSAASAGGGMHNFFPGSALVVECRFIGNNATFGGGMQNFNGNHPTVINCVFQGNTAESDGGALHNSQSSSPTLVNCVFANNTASMEGGALYNVGGSSSSATNCSFSGNGAVTGGAVYSTDQGGGHSTSQLNNCIVYNNQPDELHTVAGAIVLASHSNIRGGFPGNGNIDADPLFVDPEQNESNLHLDAGSPCIDSADNDAVPPDVTTDLDADPRFVDDPNTPDTGNPDGIHPIVDMGAYEFQPADLCADDDGDGQVTICHAPPGNPDNAHTISVSVNALPAHLAHGDSCGPCGDDGVVILVEVGSEACHADLNGDGVVNASDLAQLLGGWGVGPDHPGDLDSNAIVNAFDLALLLGSWGPCP